MLPIINIGSLPSIGLLSLKTNKMGQSVTVSNRAVETIVNTRAVGVEGSIPANFHTVMSLQAW